MKNRTTGPHSGQTGSTGQKMKATRATAGMEDEITAALAQVRVHPSMDTASHRGSQSGTMPTMTVSDTAEEMTFPELDNLNPEHVYTRTEDSKGHSMNIRCKIPKHMMGAIGNIIDKFPCYRNISDFLRDSMMHRLAYLSQSSAHHKSPLAASELVSVFIQAERDRYANQVQSAEAGIQAMRENFRTAMRFRDLPAADLMIATWEQSLPSYHPAFLDRAQKAINHCKARLMVAKLDNVAGKVINDSLASQEPDLDPDDFE